jgi:hypothetical protein
MSDATLTGLFDTAWQHLSRGVADRRHPARHPTLATLSPDGPELRTLVLRAADRATATLELHTDAASPKAAQIVSEPRVALHLWLPKPRLQLRARAVAELAQGDPALFDRLPPEAQANYGGAVPGTPLDATWPGKAGNGDGGDPDRFARILCRLTALDVLHLGDVHARAIYRPETGWQGRWIAA